MTPRVTPEQLLARAPHEFNTSGGVLGAVKQAPQNLLIALLKLYRTSKPSPCTVPCADWG